MISTLRLLSWRPLAVGVAFIALIVGSALWISALKVRLAWEESARVQAETEARKMRERAQELEQAYDQLARAVQEQAQAIRRWEQAAQKAREEGAQARARAQEVIDLQGREVGRLRSLLAAPGAELKRCEDAVAEIRAALARERAR